MVFVLSVIFLEMTHGRNCFYDTFQRPFEGPCEDSKNTNLRFCKFLHKAVSYDLCY